MADHYCLPESDPCYSTLEAYKSTVDAQLKAFMQAVQYQQYGGRIEQWRQCCPGKNEEVERWRSKQPDPEPLRKLVLPANIYNPDGACAEHLYFSRPGAPESCGKAWFQDREKSWFQTWDSIYSKLSEDLHACCVKSFDKCLSDAKYNRPGKFPNRLPWRPASSDFLRSISRKSRCRAHPRHRAPPWPSGRRWSSSTEAVAKRSANASSA